MMEWYKMPLIRRVSLAKAAQEAKTDILSAIGFWTELNEIAYTSKEPRHIATPEGMALGVDDLAKHIGTRRTLIERLTNAFLLCSLLELEGSTFILSLTPETVSPSALRMRRHRERNRACNSDTACDGVVASHASSSSCTSSSVTETEGGAGETKDGILLRSAFKTLCRNGGVVSENDQQAITRLTLSECWDDATAKVILEQYLNIHPENRNKPMTWFEKMIQPHLEAKTMPRRYEHGKADGQHSGDSQTPRAGGGGKARRTGGAYVGDAEQYETAFE
jgi:hypothetical protein